MRITESRLRRIIRSVILESNEVFPKDKQVGDMWNERSRRSRKPSEHDLDRAYSDSESIGFMRKQGLDERIAHGIASVYYNSDGGDFILEDFDEEAKPFLNHYFRLDLGNKITSKGLEDLVVNKLRYLSEYDL